MGWPIGAYVDVEIFQSVSHNRNPSLYQTGPRTVCSPIQQIVPEKKLQHERSETSSLGHEAGCVVCPQTVPGTPCNVDIQLQVRGDRSQRNDITVSVVVP